MGIEQNIAKAMEDSFKENNKTIRDHNSAYKKVTEYIKSFGEAELRELEARAKELNLTSNLLETLRRTAESERERLAQELQGQNLTVEMVVNTGGGVELYIPVRHENGTGIEKDLFSHATSAMYAFDPKANIGQFGDYVAVKGKIKNLGALKKRLATPSDAMKLAKMDVVVHRMSLPVNGTYAGGQRSIVVTTTQSAIDFPHIPVHKKNQGFFPGYQVPFEIITAQGAFAAQVTSRTSEPRRGNYICSLGDGALGRIYDAMRLRKGSRLAIEEIVPKKKYSMRRVRAQ